MTREHLNILLDYVYELEGLTLLALKGKQDKARLRQLMVEKAGCIIEVCTGLEVPQDDQDSESDKTFGAFDQRTDRDSAETVRVAVDRTVDPAIVMTAAPTVTPKPAPAVPPKSTPRPTLAPAGAPAPEKVILTSPGQSAPQHRPLTKMFPINEWFLFRRELFANSDEDFKASLALVEESGSFDNAESYFYYDLQWNPEDHNVKAFMEIIRNYFRQ